MSSTSSADRPAGGLAVDHVVIGVDDLDVAASALMSRLGLTAAGGGRHPGWGTANRVVPLGDTYVELVTVVDQAEADGSPFGRWVTAMLDGAPGVGWAVRTMDLDAVAARLGLEIGAGSRTTGSGALLRWRIAGVTESRAEPALPFFIEWGDGTALPGRAPVSHPAGPATLSCLVVGGEPLRLAEWLGSDVECVEVRFGAPRVEQVQLAVPGRRSLLLVDQGAVAALVTGRSP